MENSSTATLRCQCGQNEAPSIGLDKTKASLMKKTMVMYVTMVAVSTIAIFMLEHATILSAFRTAIVAAIGKTVAANWVSSIFQ